jgi:hypothetical protein
LYPIGDRDFQDNDGNGVVDDVVLGYMMLFDGSRNWYRPPQWHGTAVAGLLGAVTGNDQGIASVAGGLFPDPGVRLIPFGFQEQQLNSSIVINSFYYALSYGARVYSSSVKHLPFDDLVRSTVASLSGAMLFVQGSGNGNDTPMTSEFAQLPGVMAVGGYECTEGARWTIPGGHGDYSGSDYGPQLSLLGPTDDHFGDDYAQMVMATPDITTPNGFYTCNPDWDDTYQCFGGTSAAAPIVASVAALVFSYIIENNPGTPPFPLATKVRKTLEHTAEDVLCDPLSCPCPDACVDLLGWDMYSGFGRVDAGRALTLPVAILDTLDVGVIGTGDVLHLTWEAFDINSENGWLDPESENAGFELHYMRSEGGLSWEPIATGIPADVRSHDWVVPEGAYGGLSHYRRVRLTVSDSGNQSNMDYSTRFWVLAAADVEAASVSYGMTLAVTPNPTSGMARISYSLPSAAHVRLEVVDVAGRHVNTIMVGRGSAGSHIVYWNGINDAGYRVDRGVYFITIDSECGARVARFIYLN